MKQDEDVSQSSEIDDLEMAPKTVSVLEEGIDETGERYFRFAVDGEPLDIPPFRASVIIDSPKMLFKDLGKSGVNLFTSSAQTRVLKDIENWESQQPAFQVATRLGWHDGCFVLPDQIFGAPKLRLIPAFTALDADMLSKYRCQGTLQEWQAKIGEPCKGNTRLMFAVSLAFTGPILRFIDAETGGGFQITGDPNTGKTSGLILCCSVWGCHVAAGKGKKGFSESWNTTVENTEITALAHNEILLPLDETKLISSDPKKRGETVIHATMKLSQYTEKGRLNQSTVRSWMLFFLSTSNLTLPQLGRAAKIVIDDAELGRMPDIPLPADGHGIYEELHGFADGMTMTNTLNSRSRSLFGTPGREFLKRLVAEVGVDPEVVREFLAKRRDFYLKRLSKRAAKRGLRTITRASERYATVYAAGALAIEYGVLTWDRNDLLRAVLSCELDGLQLVAENDALAEPSVTMLRSKLVSYLSANHDQFMDLDKKRAPYGKHEFGSVAGYKATHKDEFWFYLSREQLEKIVGNGSNAKSLVKALTAARLMDCKKQSDGHVRYVVQRAIFTGGAGSQNFEWVVALRRSILKNSAGD